MIQGLDGRYTCTSELTSEKTEVRVIFPSIVMRRWVMHARKIVSIVFWCEVWHLLQNICLCGGSFNFTFIFAFSSKDLLTSLNWIAPTVLHGTPHLCLVREVQNHMLHRIEEARWKDLLQLIEQRRRHPFHFLNYGHRYLLSTKLTEEKVQFCQHSPYMIWEVASNHHRKKPLDPYVIVMTLEPIDSHSIQVYSPPKIRCIPIGKH